MSGQHYNAWTCQLHGFTGQLGDGSYDRHCEEEHGGDVIAVLYWLQCEDCGKPADSFACKIRHIQLNTGAAKAARD